MLLAVAAPLLLERFAKQELLGQLQERIGGEASVEQFKLSLLGGLSIQGLRATDADGREVLQLGQLEASASELSWPSPYPQLDAKLVGLELTLRQLPDGTWNYEAWGGEDDGPTESSSEPEEDEPVLEHLGFFGNLNLEAGRVTLVAKDGTSVVDELSAKGAVARDATLVTLDFAARLKPSEALRATGAFSELVQLEGELQGDLKHGAEAADWTFGMQVANAAGELRLAGDLSPAVLLGRAPAAHQEEGMRVKIDANSIGLNARLLPLLALLHPVFASATQLDASSVGGLLDGSLELSYLGALNLEADPATQLRSALQALSGTGDLSIGGAKLSEVPLIKEMYGYLGVQSEELNLAPLRFDLQAGRLDYRDGWGWRLGGVETRFTGSVGLDGSLDLSWQAPVTEGLIAKYSFLEQLRGQTLAVPIGGNMQDPSFEFQGALDSLGQGFVKQKALDKLGLDEVPDLNDLGTLGLEQLGLGAGQGDPEDPANLLKQADQLWEAGKKEQAAALYRRIRSEHKNTLTYTFNRSKIKRRGKYPN